MNDKVNEVVNRFAFALDLDNDDVKHITNLVEDNLDENSDYETIVDVLYEYNDGSIEFDDLCTEIFLAISQD